MPRARSRCGGAGWRTRARTRSGAPCCATSCRTSPSCRPAHAPTCCAWPASPAPDPRRPGGEEGRLRLFDAACAAARARGRSRRPRGRARRPALGRPLLAGPAAPRRRAASARAPAAGADLSRGRPASDASAATEVLAELAHVRGLRARSGSTVSRSMPSAALRPAGRRLARHGRARPARAHGRQPLLRRGAGPLALRRCRARRDRRARPACARSCCGGSRRSPPQSRRALDAAAVLRPPVHGGDRRPDRLGAAQRGARRARAGARRPARHRGARRARAAGLRARDRARRGAARRSRPRTAGGCTPRSRRCWRAGPRCGWPRSPTTPSWPRARARIPSPPTTCPSRPPRRRGRCWRTPRRRGTTPTPWRRSTSWAPRRRPPSRTASARGARRRDHGRGRHRGRPPPLSRPRGRGAPGRRRGRSSPARRWASPSSPVYGELDTTAVALLEEALVVLPPVDSPLRLRVLALLGARLAAGPETSRSERLVDEAAAMARRLDDPDALTFALWVTILVFSRREGTRVRLAAADEILALANRADRRQRAPVGAHVALRRRARAGPSGRRRGRAGRLRCPRAQLPAQLLSLVRDAAARHERDVLGTPGRRRRARRGRRRADRRGGPGCRAGADRPALDPRQAALAAAGRRRRRAARLRRALPGAARVERDARQPRMGTRPSRPGRRGGGGHGAATACRLSSAAATGCRPASCSRSPPQAWATRRWPRSCWRC